VTKSAFLMFSSPADVEREDEYNDWYQNVLVVDVLKIPGVVAARRYRLADVQGAMFAGLANGNRYLAMYDIDGSDPKSVNAEITTRVADGRIRVAPDLLSMNPPPVSVFFDQI
jgi:hypothetical protein